MHSKTTAVAILEDFTDEGLDYWVTGFGTGGTLKGVARVLAEKSPKTKIIVCEPDNLPILSSGIPQPRAANRSPSASHPNFRPHVMQGWSPDFIPKLTEDAVSMKLIHQIVADQRGGRDAAVTGAGAEGRNLCRYLKRRDVLGRLEDLRVSAERIYRTVYPTPANAI